MPDTDKLMGDHPTLSVIMPALNEEAHVALALQNTLDALDHFSIPGEIIAVNDGSRDRTPQIIEEFMARDPRVRVIHHENPRGIGASFWEGVDDAANEIVIMLPGDNENDPWEIMQYIRLLEHVDIVIPFVYNRGVRSAFRNILSFVYRSVINSTFMVNFNYTNGTVLYRKCILKELEYRSASFFFQTDILIRAVKKGYLFAEVPYRLGLRLEGKSKAVSYPSLLRVARGYLRLVRDFYFSKKSKVAKDEFVAGSSTSRRYATENTLYKVKK
ncbi:MULTISPECIES: glycosyltransferase family 2 protein [unclassified Nitrospina]|uniref:glycosyltransferase family 2 protein n=1 Tax=unclassified Nitrospina TaxID=2638683 RepID=UPI003F9C5904